MELELREPACDVRGMPAGDNNRPGTVTQALIDATCQHIFHVNPVYRDKSASVHLFYKS